MYHYNDLPPNDNSNPQKAYPYSYQEAFRGYAPRQPHRSRRAWRVLGWLALIGLVLTFGVGHHGFLWFFLLMGAFFFFSRQRRFSRRNWSSRGFYPQQQQHYYTKPEAVEYYPTPFPPNYSAPPRPAQTEQAGSSWPTPNQQPNSDQQ